MDCCHDLGACVDRVFNVQPYASLSSNARFPCHNLKSCVSHEENETWAYLPDFAFQVDTTSFLVDALRASVVRGSTLDHVSDINPFTVESGLAEAEVQ